MSASGQLPGFTCGVQLAITANWFFTPCGNRSLSGRSQRSHTSSEMRHSCALAATSAEFSSGAGPGDRLSTIGRWVWPVAFTIARWIMRISAPLYGCEEIQSTLM